MAASLDKFLVEELELRNLQDYTPRSIRGKRRLKKFSKQCVAALSNPSKKERERVQGKLWERYSEILQSIDLNVYGEIVVIKMKTESGSSKFSVGQVPEYLMDRPYHPVLFLE